MEKAICSFIYHNILGWKSKVTVPDFDKYIICAAPHTSNFDLFIGKLFIAANGRKTGFMMKKFWFFWPLGYLFRAMGGVPVERNKKTSLVDQMIKKAQESKKFHLAITPEGTRKKNGNWKKGFYYIAKGANLPIILIGIDYVDKCISAEKVIYPSGDMKSDLREIKLYYKNFRGKHPERFSIGNVE